MKKKKQIKLAGRLVDVEPIGRLPKLRSEGIDPKHWLADLVNGWWETLILEGALPGWSPSKSYIFAAGQIVGIARTYGLETTSISMIVHGAAVFEDGEYSKTAKSATRFCDLLLDKALGNPWHQADEPEPEGWFGPVRGGQDQLAWLVCGSRAKDGGRRTLRPRLREGKGLWGRMKSRTKFEVFFNSEPAYQTAVSRSKMKRPTSTDTI